MVEKVPSLKGGGVFWFTDLTALDPLYILPVLTDLLGYSGGMQFVWCDCVVCVSVHHCAFKLGVPLLLACMLSVVGFRGDHFLYTIRT